MNEGAILRTIKPYLNSKNEISEEEFSKLFDILELREQYKVIEIFIKNEIFLVDKKDSINNFDNNQQDLKPEQNKRDISTKIYKNTSNEQLCIMLQQGDNIAKQSLLFKCKDFIAKEALRISGRYKHKLTTEDFIQIGNMGALIAAERFDPTKGGTYLTYAKYRIDQYITRHIMDEGFIIRLPVHMFEAVNKITHLQTKYKDLDQDLVEKRICEELNIKKEKYNSINKIKKDIMDPRYLEELINDTDNAEIIDSFIAEKEDLKCSEVERNALENDLKNDIKKLLTELKPKEQEVIILRFDLEANGSSKTLDEIGQAHGVSRERIRQIEARALSKLKKLSKCRKLGLDIDLKSTIINFNSEDIIYSFKDKNGNSRIPERNELLKKILELFPDIIDEDELTEKFLRCAKQNGYGTFNAKEKDKIKQAFFNISSGKYTKNPIKELVEIIADLDPKLLKSEDEFYTTFKDLALDYGYQKSNVPRFDEMKFELDKYKDETKSKILV